MTRWSVLLRRATWLAFLPLAVVACDQATPTGDPFDVPEPADLIVDSGDHDSDLNFVWYAPIASGNTAPDAFNPDLNLSVVICRIEDPTVVDGSNEVCAAEPIITYGPDAIWVDTEEEKYRVNWPLDETGVQTGVYYRIFVRSAEYTLGYADVAVGDNMKEAMNLATGETFAVPDDRTLPLAWHAGNINPCEDSTDCFYGTILPSGGSAITRDEKAVAIFPNGWINSTDYPDGVTVQILPVPYDNATNPCIPVDYGVFFQSGLCYEYTTEPDVGNFAELVHIGQCRDFDAENYAAKDELQLAAWDAGEPLRILPNAPTPTGLSCGSLVADDGILNTLKHYASQLFFPSVAWAADVGLGATIGSFSTVGWMAPLYADASPDPSAELRTDISAGDLIETAVQVRAEHTHQDPDQSGGWLAPTTTVEGQNNIPVTFELFDHTGASQGSETVTSLNSGGIDGFAQPTDIGIFSYPSGAVGVWRVEASGPFLDGIEVFEVVPEGFGTIEGSVTEIGTGNPIVGESVNVQNAQGAITNTSGDYQLQGVPTGPQRVAVSLTGYPEVQLEQLITKQETFTIDFRLGIGIDGTTLSSHTLNIGGAAETLDVVVKNGLGTAVAPVEVVLVIEQGITARSAGGGAVQCSGVATGTLPATSTCTTTYDVMVFSNEIDQQELDPGAATLRVDLLYDDGNGFRRVDQHFIPITLQ